MNKLKQLIGEGRAIFASVLCLSSFVLLAPSALAETVTNVKYIDADGTEKTCSSATVVESSSSGVTWSGGWYVVNDTITITVMNASGATCVGEVHLILADGASLTVGSFMAPGVMVTGEGNALTIYGQKDGTGKLLATGPSAQPAIGGPACSHVTINGGDITANGSGAVGIGAGMNGTCSYVTINGGKVKATNSEGMAIGVGKNGTASNIFAGDNVAVLAVDWTGKNTNVIAHTSTTDLSTIAAFTSASTILTELQVALEPIPSSVAAPANATAAVYTNGVLSADGIVLSNGVATVVYTADEGYAFADGATAVTNKLDTTVNPAVDKSGKTPTAYNCSRTEVDAKNSPHVLEEGKTYTAAPATDKSGGAFHVKKDATLTGTNVTFAANSAYLGGAICNEGTVTLDNATFEGNTLTLGVGGAVFNNGTVNLDGTVTLKTASDTFANVMGTLNWNLADGKAGQLVGYDKLGNEGGTLRLTVDDATTLPAVIATGDFSNVADKDTFTVTNVTSGVTATIKIGSVANIGGDWYALSVQGGELTLAVLPMATLSNVPVVDAETGATNATAKVYAGETEIEPNDDGTYTVPQGVKLRLDYALTEDAQDDYMFAAGLKAKTVYVGPLTGDYSLTADDKPTAEALWVDATVGRMIAIDTRTRIVVESPDEVLPVAYSTNFWGEATGGKQVGVSVQFNDEDKYTALRDATNENGYCEWMLTPGAFGKYTLCHVVVGGGPMNFTANSNFVYYSQPYALTWSSAGGTLAVTNAGAAIASGDEVLGFELVNVTATPETHYQFTGWSATTNGVALPAKAFGSASSLATTFEMPAAAAELSAGFAWQTSFKNKKTVGKGEEWPVYMDDDYQQGLTNNGTVVWKPGATNAFGAASGLADFGRLHNGENGKLQIVVDASLTNGTYKLAGKADSAVGQTFEITNGTGAKDCPVVSKDKLDETDWTYLGAKRFKLYVDDDANLQLIVEPGIPMALVFAASPTDGGTVAASTNGVNVASGTKVYPGEEVTVVATTNLHWQFVNWKAVDATNGVVTVADDKARETTFKMAETNATVLAFFTVADSYRAETAQAITNAANDAIEAINAMNLSDDEKEGYVKQIKNDRDAQVAVIVDKKTTRPAEVAAALAAAEEAFAATKAAAQAWADRTWAIEAVVAYTNIAGTVSVTNESQARLAVEVTATTNLHWQFTKWEGVDAAGKVLSFADPANATTTFKMPETNVTVTANFIVEPKYRAEIARAITNAANAAIGAITNMNLTAEEMKPFVAQVAADRDAQVAALVAAKTPDEVAAALAAAEEAFAATQAAAQAMADRTWAIKAVVAYTNVAGYVAVTNESQARLDVTVKAKPADYWQFTNWEGVDAAGKVLSFADPANATTTFEMPETNVTVTANFIVDPTYKADCLKATDEKKAETDKALEALRGSRLTDEECDAALGKVQAAYEAATNAIANAVVPENAFEAAMKATADFKQVADAAGAESAAKPYDLVIANDFSVEPFTDVVTTEEGVVVSFVYDGVAYTNGVTAFTSFHEAYVEVAKVPFVTNVHVFGAQTIGRTPTQQQTWNLDLVSTETLGACVVTVAADLTKEPSVLVDITQKLGKITGAGAIVLGKSDADVHLYDAYIAGEVAVTTAGEEPQKDPETGAVEVEVVDTPEAGEAIVVPAVENTSGDIVIVNTASNAVVVAGKIDATEKNDVTIAHESDGGLVVAGAVVGKDITIEVTKEEASVVFEEPIVAAGDLNLVLNGRLDCFGAQAVGEIRAVNLNHFTMIGRYEGKSVSLYGENGGLSDATFAAAETITLTGTNVLTGALTFESGAVTNEGQLVWSYADGKSGFLADFASVEHAAGASLGIWVDESPTNGVYVLADNAATAEGAAFTVTGSEGVGGFPLTVGGETGYVGAKAFTLAVTGGRLVLTVSDGLFSIVALTANVGDETKGDGGTVAVASEGVVGQTVATVATPAEFWQFNGWTGVYAYAGVTNELAFADAAAASTTFAMPVGDVTVLATFALSETYRAEAYAAVTNDAAVTKRTIDTTVALSEAEQAALYEELAAELKAATDAITTAVRPEAVAVAAAGAAEAFEEIRDAAEGRAEGNARFAANRVEGVEGEKIEVVVYGGSKKGPTQVTVSLQKNTLTSFTASYGTDAKGKEKKAKFPLVLNWDAGDREPKTIVFTTKADTRSVDADEFLTLQLGSEAALKSVKPEICTLVVHDATTPTADETPYVRALAWPANGGKVSGFGELKLRDGEIASAKTLKATANRWADFDGWYAAKADDPNTIDLTKKLSGERSLKVGKGTEYGAGTYFAYFTDVDAVASVNLPDAAAGKGVAVDAGAYVGTVGVKFALPVSFTDATGAGSMSVSGLPSGLKYDKKTGLVTGVPTKATEKSVKFVAKNAAGQHTATFEFVIEELDPRAIGTFDGVLRDDRDGDAGRAGMGSVTFTAGQTGVLSAKVTTREVGTDAFSVKGYDRIDADTLGITVTNRAGAVFAATLKLGKEPETWAGTTVAITGTVTGGAFSEEGETGTFELVRNDFAKSEKNAAALAALAAYKGTYETEIYASKDASLQVGTATFKVGDNGVVTVKARLFETLDGIRARQVNGKAGAFRYDAATGVGGLEFALVSGEVLWSADVTLDADKLSAKGDSRCIFPNADKTVTTPVDVDLFVGVATK